MYRLLIVATLGLASMGANAQTAYERITTLMKTPPELAADEAVKSGDIRFMLVPNCVDLVPGYPIEGIPTVAPLGRKDTKQPAPSCEDLLGPQLAVQVIALNQYAQSYNRALYNLTKVKAPK
jgi:hypothetical protein